MISFDDTINALPLYHYFYPTCVNQSGLKKVIIVLTKNVTKKYECSSFFCVPCPIIYNNLQNFITSVYVSKVRYVSNIIN